MTDKEVVKSGNDCPSGSLSAQTGTEKRSVKTRTVTEIVDGKKKTKTITEEIIIKPDGEKIVNVKETVTSGEDDSCESAVRDMSDFLEDCLKAHNSARAKHGVPGLKLAKDLSAHAQNWADELAARDEFEHSKCVVNGERVGENIACMWSSGDEFEYSKSVVNGERVGENIACMWSSGDVDYTGQEVVDQWYSEIKEHKFGSDGANGSSHFTQVVWKDSKELGVGKAKTAGGKVIVVANYRPAGNMTGSYHQNLFPPK